MSTGTREPKIDRSRVQIGRTYDLTVRFGSQSRTKCRVCTCYLSVNGSVDVTCNRCSTSYRKDTDGRFCVTGLP